VAQGGEVAGCRRLMQIWPALQSRGTGSSAARTGPDLGPVGEGGGPDGCRKGEGEVGWGGGEAVSR
jgi:hypothetical protein